jgi:hypothetical protein
MQRMQGGSIGRGLIALLGALFACLTLSSEAQAAAPLIEGVGVSEVSETSATFLAKVNPQAKATRYRFEYGTSSCASPGACTSIPIPEAELPPGSSPVEVEVKVEGLSPSTLYHYRLLAKNGEQATSPDRIFTTRGSLLEGLPDDRAYEQASPVDKDGGDVLGDVPEIKATANGDGITFASTSGIPGAKGAQELPTYLGSRGTSAWSTQGLLPPFSAGQRVLIVGWSPNYTQIYSQVTRLGAPRTFALVVQSTNGGEPIPITPYVAGADYYYAGESQDGSVVLFESQAKLLPKAREGFSNLYAWDRETGQLSLADVDNEGNPPLKGALAGPYEWTRGISAETLRLGGSFRGFYLRDERAVSADGSLYFTEVGTGQLYQRLNPTQAQSPLNGEGKCTDPSLACTLHLSATKKTNGKGKGPGREGSDAAGPQPAAFGAASADGSVTYFTSPEKLTNDANTGLEQAPAQIELGSPAGSIEDEEFIPSQKALGLAVDAEHIYWVDPALGTIGRADLDGTERNPAFIEPGTIECEVKGKPGTFEAVASRPRSVAVDAGHVYWTDTGCSDENGPIAETGTIGRAAIDGSEVEAAFIEGATNPQGIAVNATHVYWANAGITGVSAIGRATIAGGEVKQSLIAEAIGGTTPYGVALSATHVYFDLNGVSNNFSYIARANLDGKEAEAAFVGEGARGLAVDASHVYWANQGDEAIGRANLELKSVETEFIPLEGKPNGLAADGAHLYWSTNGEAPTNPGNDLYRYQPASEALEDLTPDATGNGAEVQGVLGASEDGSYLYFAANGVLDDAEEATPGDCKGTVGSASGKCNLYLWHEGSIRLVARLSAGGSEGGDALNWAATPQGQFGTSSYVPKTSFLSADGKTLLFRSQEQLSAYENEGTPELYRFNSEDPEGIRCVSCNPAGEGGNGGPQMGRINFPGIGPVAFGVQSVSNRILSADGKRAFFETPEALSPADTNGQGGCPLAGTGVQDFPACTDVYEWEAPGAGTCKEGGPSYSSLNGGCVYLISTGKSKYPSLFADASESGNDVFFFTRDPLVGQDKDELQDVYDARVGGGLASQNPVAVIPCESTEACHGPVQSPPSESSPGSATFVGPGNPAPKHKAPKKQKKKHHKKKHHKKKKAKRAKANERSAR